jgi:hypothetical protein
VLLSLASADEEGTVILGDVDSSASASEAGIESSLNIMSYYNNMLDGGCLISQVQC